MDYMFDMSGCQGDASFNNPPFTWMTKFGRNNLINTDYMFRNCKLLRYVVLQYWPIGNEHRPSGKIVSSIGMFADTNVWKPTNDSIIKLWDLGLYWKAEDLPYNDDNSIKKIDDSGTPLNESSSNGKSFFHVGLGNYNIGMPLWVPAHSQQLYFTLNS